MSVIAVKRDPIGWGIWRWLVGLCALGSLCGPTSSAQVDEAGRRAAADLIVQQWVADASSTPVFEVSWNVPTRLVDRDGTVLDEFTLREEYLFRWPCCFKATGRVVQQSDAPPDVGKQMRFDYDESIDADGRHRKNLGTTGTFQEYEPKASLAPLLASKVIDAPCLLGMWLAESGAEVSPAQWTDDGRVIASVEDLHLRFTLSPLNAGGAIGAAQPWGVQQLEFLKPDGSVRSAWTYSDFIVPDGFRATFGKRRAHKSSQVHAQGAEPEATVVEARALGSVDDAIFALELGTSTTTDPRTGEVKTGTGEVIGHERSGRRGGLPWALMGSAGVAIIVGGFVIWMVRKSR